MAIVIADPHGNPDLVREFLAHRPDQPHVVLGDLVDSQGAFDVETEKASLKKLLESDAILIWGNHDLAYLLGAPWSIPGQRFGRFASIYYGARDRFIAAAAIDGWLCTHAGVAPELARLIPQSVVMDGVDAVATWLNDEFALQSAVMAPGRVLDHVRYGHGPLFNVPRCRQGADNFGGIFWFDPEGEQTEPSCAVGRQLFGHTRHHVPQRGESWLNLNAQGWAYDTEEDRLFLLL